MSSSTTRMPCPTYGLLPLPLPLPGAHTGGEEGDEPAVYACVCVGGGGQLRGGGAPLHRGRAGGRPPQQHKPTVKAESTCDMSVTRALVGGARVSVVVLYAVGSNATVVRFATCQQCSHTCSGQRAFCRHHVSGNRPRGGGCSQGDGLKPRYGQRNLRWHRGHHHHHHHRTATTMKSIPGTAGWMEGQGRREGVGVWRARAWWLKELQT